jgi:hypothetical protein
MQWKIIQLLHELSFMPQPFVDMFVYGIVWYFV